MNLTVAGAPLIAALLASVRIVAWLAIVPPFSSRAVPAMVKVIIAVSLSLVVAPRLADDQVEVSTVAVAVNVLTQVGLGLAMGFVTYLLFTTIAAAGSLIDVFGGFSLAQGFDPLGLNMTTVFGKFHSMLATMLLFTSGGHLIVIGGLLKSFDVAPLGGAVSLPDDPGVFVTAFGMFALMSLQIALPMIAVLFVADLGLALLTKVAPQLNAINVMFPAKIGLTLLLVGMSFPVLPQATTRLVELALEAMAAVAGG